MRPYRETTAEKLLHRAHDLGIELDETAPDAETLADAIEEETGYDPLGREASHPYCSVCNPRPREQQKRSEVFCGDHSPEDLQLEAEMIDAGRG